MGLENFSISSFQQYLRERRLMGSRCNDCGALYLPPRPICPACQTRKMSWAELGGKGTVIGFTSIAIVPADMAARGFGCDNPYVTAVVAMEEGTAITARIDLAGAADDERSVHVGMAMRADFQEEAFGEEKGVTLVFRPD